MKNSSLWSDLVLEKGVIFHEFDFETSTWSLKINHKAHTTSCDEGVFFFHSYLATPKTDWAQISTGQCLYQILPENVALSNLALKCVQAIIVLWFYQILPKIVALSNLAWKCVQGLMVLSNFAWKCGFMKFCLKMCASYYSLMILLNFA